MIGYRNFNAEPTAGFTRIELLLALYDKALERLEIASAALGRGEDTVARYQLAKTQLILSELASGVRVEVNPEANTNMLRLYEFATHELVKATPAAVANVQKVLRTLREGFEAVRTEANELERTGQLAKADQLQIVLATA